MYANNLTNGMNETFSKLTLNNNTEQLCIAINNDNENLVNELLKTDINFNYVHNYCNGFSDHTYKYSLFDHVKESINIRIIEKMINTKKFDDVKILEFLDDINEWLDMNINNGGDNFREDAKNLLEKYIMKNMNVDFTETEIIHKSNNLDESELDQITFKRKITYESDCLDKNEPGQPIFKKKIIYEPNHPDENVLDQITFKRKIIYEPNHPDKNELGQITFEKKIIYEPNCLDKNELDQIALKRKKLW